VVRAPPRVGIEFVPVLAPRLSRGAHAMLAVALATVGVLAALSVAALRLLGFRDALVRRLEQERRLASIGQMSAVLAHEIRNPLAALKGHSQLLAEALPEAGRERARADRVVREAVRLEALTTDLLAFVRSGTISPVEVDPARLVRETADEIAPGRIDIDEAGAPARWRLDPVRMKQALSNVLENAVHASPDGARVRAVVRQDGAALAFEVRDSGEGIPAGQEELIFEPFQTRKARGTGLGLAVARRIVALHGGSIGARNDPGGGAVFSITLP
jgi:two-component system sensor histidine kinase HydH